MNADYKMLLAYLVGIIVLFLLGRAFITPVKILLKALYGTLTGALILIVINFIASYFDYHIALNVFTALITGFLGIPGVALLVILKLMF